MPGFVPFILPILAVLALLVMIAKPLFVLLNINNLRQQATRDTSGLRSKAVARGQEDEYDTLITLGFEPLGVYQETVPGMGKMCEQYILAHRKLPITCSLALVSNGELFIAMTTDSASGKLIRTSSLHPGVEVDSADCFAQAINGKTTEEIFVAHFGALDQLESRGLEPVRVETIDDVKAHYRRSHENPSMKKFLRDAFREVALVSTFLPVILPAILNSIFTTIFFAGREGPSMETIVQSFCGLSFAISAALFYALYVTKKTKKSSLAPTIETDGAGCKPANEPEYQIEKVADGESTKFILPLRDSEGARMSAFQPIAMGLSIGVFYLLLVVLLSNVSLLAAIAISVVGLVGLGALILWGIALGLGHTRYDVVLEGDQLRCIERAYFLSWSQRIPVNKISWIRVEPQDPRLLCGIFGEHARNKNACQLCLYEGQFKMYPVAPGYSNEVLTDLANELGTSLGLSESNVQLHEEVVAINTRALPQAMFAENEPRLSRATFIKADTKAFP